MCNELSLASYLIGSAGSSRQLVRHQAKDSMKDLIGYPVIYLTKEDEPSSELCLSDIFPYE